MYEGVKRRVEDASSLVPISKKPKNEIALSEKNSLNESVSVNCVNQNIEFGIVFRDHRGHPV